VHRADQLAVLAELADEVVRGSAEFYLLTHKGRALDESGQGSCGLCPMRVHRAQLQDPDSGLGSRWGISRTARRWLDLGVLQELDLGREMTRNLKAAVEELNR
jgi:hypothetical protein